MKDPLAAQGARHCLYVNTYNPQAKYLPGGSGPATARSLRRIYMC